MSLASSLSFRSGLFGRGRWFRRGVVPSVLVLLLSLLAGPVLVVASARAADAAPRAVAHRAKAGRGFRAMSTPAGAGEYVPLPAARIVDSTDGTGGLSSPMASGATVSFPVLGVGGVPDSGVSVVVLNVTIVNPTGNGHAVAFPAGSATPGTTDVNFLAGQSTSDTAFVQVGTDGEVSVTNSQAGTADLTVDVQGYVTDSTDTSGESTYVSVSPDRVLDSRNGTGGVSSPLTSTSPLTFTFGGTGGIPTSGVSAVVFGLTMVNESADQDVTAWQAGTTEPSSATMSVQTAVTMTKTIIVPVTSTAAGQVTFALSTGSSDIIADVQGYFLAPTAGEGATFDPVTQTRVADTRSTSQVGPTTGPIAHGSTVTVTLTGVDSTPAANVTAAAIIVTVTNATTAGNIIAYAHGASMPSITDLPVHVTSAVPSNMVIVPVSAAGQADFYFSGVSGQLVVDVLGYFTTTELTSPQDPARVANTVTLSSVAASADGYVAYWWRAGPTGTWALIPTTDVTYSVGGGAVSSWPIAASSGAFPNLVWQAASTLGTASGAVQVQDCVATTSTTSSSVCSAPANVQVTPHAFDGTWATDAVGPGTLALSTGDFQVAATDAQVSSYDGSLSVGREFDSFLDDHLSVGQQDVEVSPASNFYAYQTTVSSSATEAKTGTHSLKITPASSGSSNNTFVNFGSTNGGLSESMLPGHTYRLTSWEYVPSATGLPGGSDYADAEELMGLWHTSSGWSSTTSAAPTATNTWTQLSVTFTVPVNADGALARLFDGKAEGSGKVVYYDDSTLTDIGIFGPGWRSDLPGPADGAGQMSVNDQTATGGYVILTDADGDQDVYVATGSTSSYPIRYVGQGDANDGSVLTKTSASAMNLQDADGTITYWTIPSGTSTWETQSVVQPGATGANTTSYAWNSANEVTAIVAPAPPGVTCTPTSLPAGCRALLLTYATSTTASGSTLGNYAGQLESVSYKAANPAASNAVQTTVIEDYLYDSTGMLREAYDPRLSSPLITAYTYDSSGRLSTITPPGLATWTLGYDSAGRLATVSRPDPSSSTATTTIAYNVGLSGSGLPTINATTAATWGQTSDLPLYGTAVFPATHVPSGSPGSSDWPYATIHYLDVNGRETNTASYGDGPTGSGWQFGATSYDQYGNTIWSLTAENRAEALAPLEIGGSCSSSDPAGATDYAACADSAAGDTADAADLLATVNTYSLDGVELEDTLGPVHPVTLDDGSVVDARDDTHTVYSDQDGSEPSHSGPAYRLPTTITDSAQTLDGTDHDTRTTVDGYDPIDGSSDTGTTSGWTLHTPTTVTTDPAGLDLVKETLFNSSGQVLQSRMPSDSSGTTAGTTVTTYYAASGSGSCVSATFDGLVCSTGPAAQPAGTTIATTTTTYDYYGQPVTVTDTSGTATRTTTTSYDAAERPSTNTISSTVGSSLPAVTTGYDSGTGLPTTVSTGTGGSAVTLTTGYDDLGRATSYTDADGNTSTSSYDLDGRVTSAYDGKGTTTSSYEGTDASGHVENRGLVTSETDSAVGTFTAAYNADGNLLVEDYPSGVTATWTYDNAGNPTSLTYTKSGSTVAAYSESYNSHGQVVQAATPLNTQTYAYDADGRLVQTQDVTSPASGSGLTATCITRQYSYDVDSNRRSLVSYPASSGTTCSDTTTPTSSSHSYDAADRITDTGYSYDTLGRTLTVPAAGTTGTGTLTLGYFSNDFVASETQNGTTVSYTVDPGQERPRTQTSSASGITTTNHYVDGSDSPAWAANSDGSWTRNVAGPDGNLAATADSTGTLTLDLPNMHGDIGATIADSSSVPASSAVLLAYTEFGTPDTAATPTTSTVGGASADYGYEGAHRRSAGDLGGLLVMGQRLYNPTTGRFLQTDPVPGGSANNYDYANQDPINNCDLNGQSWWHHLRHFVSNHWRGLAQGALFAGCVVASAAICLGAGIAVGLATNVDRSSRGWSYHYRSAAIDVGAAVFGGVLGRAWGGNWTDSAIVRYGRHASTGAGLIDRIGTSLNLGMNAGIGLNSWDVAEYAHEHWAR